ncbi:MAG: putative amidophosphoribosyltransferase [Bacteroidetes bacterium]|nr:putative amidophosphoribosyltransferase [Bacteroidota bacterium]
MALPNIIGSYLNDLLLLAFPNNCLACSGSLMTDEKDICFSCIDSFPETHYHLSADNPVAQHFWGRVPLAHAASYLYVRDGNMTQTMIHQLKYKEKKKIGVKLGRLYGYKMKQAESLFPKIDLIVPVPLHANRKNQRGYNQSDVFAQGLSEILEVPYEPNVMKRVVETVSQTKRSRYERWENVEGIFELSEPDKIKGKHILLVDDVITTGATIESSVTTLLKGENVTVSVATIATAGR